MALPLITIESRGSNKRDDNNIDTFLLMRNSSSDGRTKIQPYHATVTAEITDQARHDGWDGDSRAPNSQRMSSSSSTVPETALPAANNAADMSIWRLTNILLAVGGMSFLTSFSTGVLTISIPRTAEDIGLSEDLLLWPSSVFPLACGSCLLLAGSIADVIGNRILNITGCLLAGCFMVACGLARTGVELIMFRCIQGIAVSLCLPTSVAIVSNAVPSGRKRNISFSILGFVQPAGFSAGLVLGGVMLDTIGWRYGWFLSGGLTIALFVISMWVLPADQKLNGQAILVRLRKEVDWVAGLISCACLSMLSYFLAKLSNNASNITQPGNIALLVICISLVPLFLLWEQRQERLGKPTLMPNSLWRNTVFTNVCVMVLFAWAVVNVMETYCSLFFQKVQGLSAIQASLRILPSMIIGSICQLSTGLLVHRLSAFYLVVGSVLLSTGGPLLMAVINVQWPYWSDAFLAQLCTPLSADILFTVALLVISDVFPPQTQALAGAVFNTVTQFGNSLGLTVVAVISSAVTKHAAAATSSSISSTGSNDVSPAALLAGYRAGFWAAFAWMMFAFLIGTIGLRRIGKVGVKQD